MNKALFDLLHNSTNPNFNDVPSNIKFIFIFYTIMLAFVGFLIYSIIYEHIEKSRPQFVKISIIIIIISAALSGIRTYTGPIKSAIDTKKQWEPAITTANKSKPLNLSDHPLLFNTKTSSSKILKPFIDNNLSINWVNTMYNNEKYFSIKNGKLHLKLSMLKDDKSKTNNDSSINIYGSYINTNIELIIDQNSNVTINPLDPIAQQMLNIETQIKEMKIRLKPESIMISIGTNNEISMSALTPQNKIINISSQNN